MKRILIGAIAVAQLAVVCATCAGQAYLVSEFVGGNIWRIEDINGDGDALDIGEKTLWGDGFVFAGAMESDGRSIFALETGRGDGNNEVVRLTDINGDGDALDVGERTVWASGLGLPIDILRRTNGNLLVSGFQTNEVWQLTDANGDGDALDTAEQSLFADNIANPRGLLHWNGGILSTAFDSGEVFFLQDTNGDGNALDAAERSLVLSGVNSPYGLLDYEGGIHIASFTGGTVYQAMDRNADGDFLDNLEVLSYADSVFGSLNSPTFMSPYFNGGYLLSDTADSQVLWVRDRNGDGDALDLGDVVTFADGFSLTVDIIALPEGLPGDYNGDGFVDAADYTVWRNNLGDPSEANINFNGDGEGGVDAADYNVWKIHYGSSGSGSGGGGVSTLHANVPEPSTLLLSAMATLVALSFRPRRHAS